MEISERKRHHEVLLTFQNLNDLSHNPALYSVPVISRPLPTEIVEGEHYVTADLLNLLLSSSSPSRELETKAVGWELVICALLRQSSYVSEDSGQASQASRQCEEGSHLGRLPLARKGSRPAPRAVKGKKGTLGQKKVPGAGVENFVPWVPPISNHPPNWEEEEEEKEMFDLVHNFATRKRKRDVSFKRVVDVVPEVAGGKGPDVQVIVISGSPEMGSNDQSDLENATLVESREASLTPTVIQVIHPPEQAPSRPERPLYTRAERSRPWLPDRLLLNSYHPPRGLAPPMKEVLAPGPEGAQEIIDRWRPFNRGKSSADRLHDLYPGLLRIPVTVLAEGKGEEYAISTPSSTSKEDLLQMVEDGMMVCNLTLPSRRNW